jgi:hypothetical protein
MLDRRTRPNVQTERPELQTAAMGGPMLRPAHRISIVYFEVICSMVGQVRCSTGVS